MRRIWIMPLTIVAAAGGGIAADDRRPTTIEGFMTPGSPTRVIAHRGFSGRAPENTLVAVQRAIDVGADMVEVDVTVTADRHVVCLHDETLDRTTSGRGRAFEQPLEAIRLLDAGSWFSTEFAGEKVPTLTEVLTTISGRTLVNIEIKPEAVELGIVPMVAALVAKLAMHDQVVVSSFSPEALRQMKIVDPAVVTASLFNAEIHAGRDPLEIVQEVGSRGFNISSKRLTPDLLDRCHRHGIPVAVYTANEPPEMRRLVDLGVDAIFTDHPDRLIRVLQEHTESVASAR